MTRRIILIYTLLITSTTFCFAQTAKKVAEPVDVASSESLVNKYHFSEAETQLQKIITQKKRKKLNIADEQRILVKAQIGSKMLEATQQVVFIDSIVATRHDFLSKIKLSSDAGIIATFNDFFHNNSNEDCYVYRNAFADKCIYAEKDSDGYKSLYSSFLTDNEWSKPLRMKGFEGEHTNYNYPFVLGDGVTLYYSAQSKDGLGGYDIYVTRYDNEAGKYLKPENIGMPFNSPANDYMYCEDETNNIGWFVTDRNQDAEHVCIYVFIPNENREVYSREKISENQMISYARINNIAETWGDGKEKDAAMARLQKALSGTESTKKKNEFTFPINDEVTYHNMTDFHSTEAKNLMAKILNKRGELAKTSDYLDKLRDKYASANEQHRLEMKTELMQMEEQQEQLTFEVHSTEKQLRNLENNNR